MSSAGPSANWGASTRVVPVWSTIVAVGRADDDLAADEGLGRSSASGRSRMVVAGNGLDGRRALARLDRGLLGVRHAVPAAGAGADELADRGADERDRRVEPATGHRREVAAPPSRAPCTPPKSDERVVLVEVECLEQVGAVRVVRGHRDLAVPSMPSASVVDRAGRG